MLGDNFFSCQLKRNADIGVVISVSQPNLFELLKEIIDVGRDGSSS